MGQKESCSWIIWLIAIRLRTCSVECKCIYLSRGKKAWSLLAVFCFIFIHLHTFAPRKLTAAATVCHAQCHPASRYWVRVDCYSFTVLNHISPALISAIVWFFLCDAFFFFFFLLSAGWGTDGGIKTQQSEVFRARADLVWLPTDDNFSLHWIPVWAHSWASGCRERETTQGGVRGERGCVGAGGLWLMPIDSCHPIQQLTL